MRVHHIFPRDARRTTAAQIFRERIASLGLRAVAIDCACVAAAIAVLAAAPFVAFGIDTLLMETAR